MNPVEFLRLLLDGTVKFYHKIGIIVSVLFCLIIFDNIFGFSKFRYAQCKVETIKLIEEVASMDSIPLQVKLKLRKQELAIVESRNISDRIYSWTASPSKSQAKVSYPASEQKKGTWDELVNFGILFYVLLLVSPTLVIIFAAGGDKKFPVVERAAIILQAFALFLISGVVFTSFNMALNLWSVVWTPLISGCFLISAFIIVALITTKRKA